MLTEGRVYADAIERLRTYGEVAGYGSLGLSLAEPGEPAQLAVGMRVSANLRTKPQLGRAFLTRL